MKILFSIKAFLNYLYNNLIDLIWVKKIRFEDGTEMSSLPVGANIYDIKKLSQAVIDKGWTYLCNSTKQMLPKAKIPTVYEDIENKYLTADKTVSDLLTYSINVNRLYRYYNFSSSLNKYILLDGSAPFKINGSINPDLSGSSILYTHNENVYAHTLIVGENIIIVVGERTNDGIPIYVFDLNLNFLRSFNVTVPNRNSTIMANVYRKGVFFIGYNYSRGDNDTLSYMITVKDNIDVNSGTCIDEVFGYSWQGSNYFYESKSQFTDVVNDKYVYVLTQSRGSNRRIYQFEISDSGDVIITNWGQYPSGTFYSNLVYFKNKFYLFNHISYQLRIYESDDCKTFTELRVSPIQEVGFLLSLGDNCLVVTNSAIYQTIDFETFTLLKNISMSRDNIVNYIKTNDYFFMLGQYTNTNFIGSTLVLKSYTDTYTINGATVNIQYYKNQDWKICISDGGSNDTNLDTVYNGLGYENYWLLDRNNEQLCLPRNSNLYTQMYVGGDYEDITVPTGVWSAVALKSDLGANIKLVEVGYENGVYWKLFSNNYIEQFGFVERSSSDITVTLKYEMTNSDYYCAISYGGNNISSGDTDSNLHIAPADNGTSTTQLHLSVPRSPSNPNKVYWEVKGFKA